MRVRQLSEILLHPRRDQAFQGKLHHLRPCTCQLYPQSNQGRTRMRDLHKNRQTKQTNKQTHISVDLALMVSCPLPSSWGLANQLQPTSMEPPYYFQSWKLELGELGSCYGVKLTQVYAFWMRLTSHLASLDQIWWICSLKQTFGFIHLCFISRCTL